MRVDENGCGLLLCLDAFLRECLDSLQPLVMTRHYNQIDYVLHTFAYASACLHVFFTWFAWRLLTMEDTDHHVSHAALS